MLAKSIRLNRINGAVKVQGCLAGRDPVRLETPSARGEKTAIYTRLQHLQLAGDRDDSQFSGVAVQNYASDMEILDPTPNNKVFALEVLDDDAHSVKERDEAVKVILSAYKKKLRHRSNYHMGYPLNQALDYDGLTDLMQFCINNLGDPFIESNYGVHSREFEVGVLNWFAKLWQIEKDEFWGCVTSCGTEGNLHGLYVGRENLPDGILYASKDSHYSVFKAARMYRMDSVKVDSLGSGEMDYASFRTHLLENKHRPAIVNVNIGTTVKGAVDDLDKIIAILAETGYTQDRFYIHCDGALTGIMLPFMKDKRSMLSFSKPIGSISVSGHKFLGAPAPCGVIIMRYKAAKAMSSDVEYLNSRDTTITGSRNGQAPIQLWYALSRKGSKGIQQDVDKCLYNSRVLKDMLQAAGFSAMLNEMSNTVVFERPREEAFVRRWQLACEGDIAHVVVMPNHDVKKLEDFVLDYVRSNARMTGTPHVDRPVVPEDDAPIILPNYGSGAMSLTTEGYMQLEDPLDLDELMAPNVTTA
ncbi:hypothetical protein CEUSTIGMA_g2082.t1 [Chlamydomonas eustigma]|uniref:Serine decarboxylase n=1 Tax=Chlamydomonas eustigma TaxID=1157962 RepID=A0A250WUW8_9CHLO|nr:hypothetical protein CEUSTIGMA_g2082.t1 [Chlamydomonas eustigma]|eukprot:GAX74634.1 hypothetical protein CEUSTIGMA_g2082.t1 [Chlamydomonas eustigma]